MKTASPPLSVCVRNVADMWSLDMSSQSGQADPVAVAQIDPEDDEVDPGWPAAAARSPLTSPAPPPLPPRVTRILDLTL